MAVETDVTTKLVEILKYLTDNFRWLLSLTGQTKWQLLSLTIFCRILTWIRLLKSFTILTLEELEVLTWQLFCNLKDLTWQRKLLNLHCTWQTLYLFDRSDMTTKLAEFLLYMTTFFRNLVDFTWKWTWLNFRYTWQTF